MKNFLLKSLLLLLPFATLQAQTEEETIDSQFEILFGASGYVLYKVLNFANDHGFRYAKILSYEFNAFEHMTNFVCNANKSQGRIFEIKDEFVSISFLCFEDAPTMDPYFIDLEKYRELLDEMQEGIDTHLEK